MVQEAITWVSADTTDQDIRKHVSVSKAASFSVIIFSNGQKLEIEFKKCVSELSEKPNID